MKVVYIGPTESHTLEHGIVYEVLSEEDGWYPKDEFKTLEDSHKINV